MIEPVAAVRDLAVYSVPRPDAPTDLRLDGNEGLLPPAWLLDKLAARGPESMRRYPDARPVQEQLAARYGLEPEQVLMTAGADEALDRVCRAFLEPGRAIRLPSPGFEMLTAYARLAGAAIEEYEWLDGFPVASASEGNAAVVAVVSPNNPTGLAVGPDDLRAVAAARSDALVLLDLAYAEFATADLMAVALELPNVVVVRSLSKSWGIAGLRVGFACGPRPLIDVLRVAGSPYSVAGTSLALAEEWLAAGADEVAGFVRDTEARRARIAATLEEGGARVWPSEANFVFARFADAPGVHAALGRRGIAVRRFRKPGLLGECLRVTCPANDADTERLLAALTSVLGEES